MPSRLAERKTISFTSRGAASASIQIFTCRVRRRPVRPSSCVGLLQRGEVEFLHLHHRYHDALAAWRDAVPEHVLHPGRHHLPGQPEFVLEPAALLRCRITTGRQLVPVVVHFGLSLAVDLQRDRLGELEDRPAVERGEGTVSYTHLTLPTSDLV